MLRLLHSLSSVSGQDRDRGKGVPGCGAVVMEELPFAEVFLFCCAICIAAIISGSVSPHFRELASLPPCWAWTACSRRQAPSVRCEYVFQGSAL